MNFGDTQFKETGSWNSEYNPWKAKTKAFTTEDYWDLTLEMTWVHKACWSQTSKIGLDLRNIENYNDDYFWLN